MTADIIQKYFLIAGASYRTSDEWKDLHTKDEYSKVLRTGRFGIGLLAAFLLGNEIEVITRHISQPVDRGIIFSCHLDQPEIELKWTKCRVGTEIRVKLNDDKFQRLCGYEDRYREFGYSWDWYTGTTPKLIRKIQLCRKESLKKYSSLEKNDFELIQKDYLPDKNKPLTLNWRRLQQNAFDDVQWNWDAHTLTCNKFKIGVGDLNGISRPNNELWQPTFDGPSACRFGVPLECPSLNVYDSDGNFPINLLRSATVKGCDDRIRPSLIEAVCRDILGSYLVGIPKSLQLTWRYLMDSLSDTSYTTDNILRHPAMDFFEGLKEDHFLIWNSEGLTLSEPIMIQDLNTKILKYVLRLPKINKTKILNFPLTCHTDEVCLLNDVPMYSTEGEQTDFIGRWIHAIVDTPPQPKRVDSVSSEDIIITHFSTVSCFESIERAIMLDQTLIEQGYGQFVKHLYPHRINRHINLYSTTSNPESWLDVDSLNSMSKVGSEYIVGFWKIQPIPKEEISLSPLAETWKKIIRQPLIPFDLETRKRELAHAYKELAPEIACWEKGGTYEAARRLERQNNT